MKNSTKSIVVTAFYMALIFITTYFIKIPLAFNGYLNLGDVIILICGFILSPIQSFLASGVGSMLADLVSGYAIYAPATFLIKGLMAVSFYYIYKLLNKSLGNKVSRLISGLIAEIIMVLGYYIFEGFIYGFGASLVNIPMNAIQGAAGLICGMIMMDILEKRKIIKNNDL